MTEGGYALVTISALSGNVYEHPHFMAIFGEWCQTSGQIYIAIALCGPMEQILHCLLVMPVFAPFGFRGRQQSFVNWASAAVPILSNTMSEFILLLLFTIIMFVFTWAFR